MNRDAFSQMNIQSRFLRSQQILPCQHAVFHVENSTLRMPQRFLLESLPTHYDNFAVTDDDTEMDTLNGTPCWIFAENAAGEDVPTFSRYMTLTDLDGSCHVLDALDFGVPRQLDIPDLEYPANKTIYARAWKDFIHDRLDKDTKVLRCRVHLDGLQVGPELLRKFYFWAGSLWVLNKITNYSLTTFDPAECEFIQVRDTDAYLNGQYQ